MPVSIIRTNAQPSLLLVLLIHQLVGCTAPSLHRVVLATSFEQGQPQASIPVLQMPPAVPNREQVHTGQWAAKIDRHQRNALLCSSTWQALGQPHHLRVRLWAWLPNGRQNAAILQVSGQRATSVPSMPGKCLYVEQLALHEVVRHYYCWVPTTLFVSLPPDLRPTDEVAVCIWGNNLDSADAIYFDDVTVENLD